MESTAIIAFDRSSQLKAFDDTKTGVKGLVNAGISEIPPIFLLPPITLSTLNPPPSGPEFTIPKIDLNDSITRQNLVKTIGDAAESWRFFQLINHGIPVDLLERMKEGTREFHMHEIEVKKGFYTRDPSKQLVYSSNFDLYSSKAANWRDTMGCYTTLDPPKLEDLPSVCG